MNYTQMNRAALQSEHTHVSARYNELVQKKHPVNMARGKPSVEQVALSHAMLTILSPEDCMTEDGTDALNYGGNDGLLEMKRIFGEMLGVEPKNVIVGGNSSLNIMFDCVATFLKNTGKGMKFLCPSPGYDRHFAICEYLGIDMLTIPMTPTGPDMAQVCKLAADDPNIMGIWCVPVFSNPQGYVYSNETIIQLAAMPTANPDFKLYWDDAYTVHHFKGERRMIANILRECEKANHPDRVLLFTSFSKISIPGAGVAAVASSENNIAFLHKRVNVQTVGPDKINQLRHTRFFKNVDGILAHMQKHAEILRPKFELADTILTNQLSATGAGSWHIPDGGYFFSLDTMPGCAKRVEILCKEAGIILTEAGATFPYGKDPEDKNLRIAPTFLSLQDLEHALHIVCAAAKLAALELLLNKVV